MLLSPGVTCLAGLTNHQPGLRVNTELGREKLLRGAAGRRGREEREETSAIHYGDQTQSRTEMEEE